MLRGVPSKSGRRQKNDSGDVDDILNVASSIYVPLGNKPCRWASSPEFSAFAERFGRSDMCFGMGDPEGLTLETPFGQSSSLIRLHNKIEHPALGTGLLSTVQLPIWETVEASNSTCMWLNFFASVSWTDVPVLGSWHPGEIGPKEFAPSYGAFIPNALYADGIATNMALWSLRLAQWARRTLWPDVKDVTMAEILSARMGPPGRI
jgi:hypothetical protein